MTAVFSTFFRQQLAANANLMNTASITMLFFREAPDFSANDPRYIGYDESEDLFTQTGWVPATNTGLPLPSPANDLALTVRAIGNNRYVIWTQYVLPANLTPVEVKAVAFVYKGTLAGVSDPMIFVSNTPFKGQRVVIKGGDALTSAPDPAITGSNRWLFSWALPPGGQTTVTAIEGALALTQGPPLFETSHTQHIWVYPQRANMIANPSFEAVGTNYWSSNGSITRVADPAPLGDGRQSGGYFAGKVTAPVDGYLDPTGTVSTPDVPDLGFNGDVRLTSKVRIKLTPGASQFLATQTGASTDLGFESQIAGSNGGYYGRVGNTAGTAWAGGVSASGAELVAAGIVDGADVYIGHRVQLLDAAGQLRITSIRSTDGVTWTDFGTPWAGTRIGSAPWNSTAPLVVGGYGAIAASKWADRIYWAQMEAVNRSTVTFPGTVNSYLSVPDSAPLQITGDVEIVVRMSQPDWNVAPAASLYFVTKGGSYQLARSSAAARNWVWQSYDNAATLVDMRVTSTVTTLAPDQMIWLRFRFDVDNGASGRTFTVDYALDQPTEPTTWTSWGTPATAAGITNIRTQTSTLGIGAINTGASPMTGRISRVIIRTAFGAATPVFDYAESNAGTKQTPTTFYATTGQIVTVNGDVAIAPVADRVIWRYDSNDYVSGLTSTGPLGRIWTLSAAGVIVPKVGDPVTSKSIILESNVFPTTREEYWTVQFMAKGNGRIKVGLVWWDDDYAETAVDWGGETWTLNPSAYIQIVICRTLYQTYQAMLRIECQGTDITIDRVLVERGFLKDWPYFDGGTTYGARDDFSWYGGQARQGASYSLWYNNKRATYGRLFARDVADDVLLTDEVEAAQGKVYQWVPAGTIVVPHIDVLYPNDLQAPVVPKTAGAVIPYRTDVYADYDKVRNPWV